MPQSKNAKPVSDVLYIIRLSPGAQYDPAKRVWEQDLKAHTLYMLELLKRNILVMAGPIDESAGQFIILVQLPFAYEKHLGQRHLYMRQHAGV